MGILKFFLGVLSMALGVCIGIKGFSMPNSSAADFFFGVGLLFLFLGWYLWILE